jgi:hypothetical protein
MKQDKKTAKQTKQKKNNTSSLPVVRKTNKLNWDIFNLLENLLIFCAVPSRRAPKESGVSFYITNPQDDAICLLFQIDREDKTDPLIRGEKIKRPDYLSLFIQDNLLLFTIIEMKGTNKNSTEHGIEQIITFKDILRTAITKCFSKKLKIQLQGILLTPYNGSIPLPEIQKQASNNFIILPIQYNQKAELYDYISKVNTKRDLVSKNSYIHQKQVESKRFLIEELLAERGLDNRKEDKYYSENYVPSQDMRGVYIDYLLPNNEDWITLLSDPNQKKIQLALSEQKYQEEIQTEEIQKELESLKLTEIINIVLRSA